MPKIDIFQLRKAIPMEEFDYTLLSSILSCYASPRRKINELLKARIIVRIKKGLYVFGPEYNQVPVCKESLANLIYGPSYISLEYALAFHRLIPERVEVVTSVTPKRNKKFKTPLGYFTYRHLKPEIYVVGIEQVEIDSKHFVLMASPEKALCDYLTLADVPRFRNEEDARDFLQEDLRIERDNFDRLNASTLRKLNQICQDQNLERIANALELGRHS